MATPEKKSRVSDNVIVKQRTSHFNKKEIQRLEGLILKYKDILFCKKLDHATTKKKDSIWCTIEEEFNADADGHRTARQLRNKFENIKKDLKREEKRNAKRARESADDDTSDWLDSASNVDGNDGYDDDAFMPKDPEIAQFVKCEINHDDSENFEPENLEDNTCSSKSNEPFESNAPQSALEKAIVRTVKRMFQAKTKELNALQQKKMKVIDEAHALELVKTRESMRQQEELHNQMMKNITEKHDLEMIKLNLEIEVLTLQKSELLKKKKAND